MVYSVGYTLIKYGDHAISSRNPLTVLTKHQTIPLQKNGLKKSPFSPKQSKTDEESITSKMLQVHAKLQPTYCIFFNFKNFRDCFLSLHPLQNAHTSSNQRSKI